MKDKFIFVDIDTQNDFIFKKGSLYVPDAEKLIDGIKKITDFATESGIKIFSSIDTHIENDPEFKHFPPHCVENTWGWEKIRESITKNYILIPMEDFNLENPEKYNQFIFKKNKFSIFSNGNILKVLKTFDVRKVYIYGVATEFCVKESALDFKKHGFETYVLSGLIKGVNKMDSEIAISEMKETGIDFISVDAFLKA